MTSSLPVEGRCALCGAPMSSVPVNGGASDISCVNNCTNAACPDGPSGLIKIRTLREDTHLPETVTKFFGNGSMAHAAVGAPSRNEENVEQVGRTFVEAVNRQYGKSFEYVPGPSSSRDERGWDCEIASRSENTRLRIQVTRGLPPAIYREQSKMNMRQVNVGVHEAAEWVLNAVRRKVHHAASDVALVVDGIEAPLLGMLTDLVITNEYASEIASYRWHSVWIIGLGGARHLAGNPLP